MERQSKHTIADRILSDIRSRPEPILEIRCATCGDRGVKAGGRMTASGRVRRLDCRPCRRHFGASPIPRNHHAAQVIVEAVTAYNLGRTILETQCHLVRRFRKVVSASTIHSWLQHFASLCTFGRVDGRLTFVRAYDVDAQPDAGRLLFWMGIAPLGR